MRKSLFISVYLLTAVAISVLAVTQVVKTQDFLTWGGVLLTTAPLLVVLAWVMVFRNVARTSARMPARADRSCRALPKRHPWAAS